MNAVDVYLDATPWRSEEIEVVDGDGVVLAPHVGLPPIGGGGAVQVFGDEDAQGTVFCEVAQTTLGYDLDLAWAPTMWSVDVDFGLRAPMAKPDRAAVGLEWEGGIGPRLSILAQPWWPDYGYAGLGGHFGLAITYGRGRVRGLLGARISAAIVPGEITGTLDTAAQDVTWDWKAGGARAGVHAGVAFR